MILPDISSFIKKNIIKRDQSLFAEDLKNNGVKLRTESEDKRVLVIGGAGTIGSSFIRVLLNYKPSSLIIIDTNENGLTELTRQLRSDNDVQLPDHYLTYPMSFASETFNKILDKSNPT